MCLLGEVFIPRSQKDLNGPYLLVKLGHEEAANVWHNKDNLSRRKISENYSKSEGKSDHFTPYLAGFTNSKRFFSPVDLTPQKLKFCLVISLLSQPYMDCWLSKSKATGEKNDERTSMLCSKFLLLKLGQKTKPEAINQNPGGKKPLKIRLSFKNLSKNELTLTFKKH